MVSNKDVKNEQVLSHALEHSLFTHSFKNPSKPIHHL